MFKENYQREMAEMKLSAERKENLVALMTAAPVRKARRAGRTVLALAVIAVLCMSSVAAAYSMGILDFMKEQNGYAFLGQKEVYETYAVPVGQSVTAENGDVLTVERVAMDGKFCTVFYAIHFHEPVVDTQELARLQESFMPGVGMLPCSLYLTLRAGGEEISMEGYDNSFEIQEYLADESTLYAAWHTLLSRPPEEREALTLEVEAWDGGMYYKENVWNLLWEASLEFEAHPIQREHVEPDVTFPAMIQGEMVEVQVLSFDRSPLGAQLTLRSPRLKFMGLSMEIALRDAATGEYIPHAEIVTSHTFDPEGYYDMVYELYGDVSGLETLELIPVWWTSSISPRIAVGLDELPSQNVGDTAGGYAPASYAVENGRIIVTMQPVGAVTNHYSRIGNGVGFLDAAGSELFSNVRVQKFKNRADGTITVVSTPDVESFQEDIDKVAQICFFSQPYQLLEDQTVTIPLK